MEVFLRAGLGSKLLESQEVFRIMFIESAHILKVATFTSGGIQNKGWKDNLIQVSGHISQVASQYFQ